MLANRFKQETGFEGLIDFDISTARFSTFEGGFPDLIFPAASDTVQARQVCNQIVDRILPYLQIPREQLSLESIGGDSRVLRAQYRQRVNGYEIEGGGRFRISYNYNLNRTVIVNGLVQIDPTPVTPRITEEEARRIFYNNVTIPDNRKEDRYYQPNDLKLMYCYERMNSDTNSYTTPQRYRLAWKSFAAERIFIIDAISGEIMLNIYSRMP